MCTACEIIKGHEDVPVTIEIGYFRLCGKHQPKVIHEVAPYAHMREWLTGLPVGIHYYRLKEVSTAKA